ncbi:MAG: lipid A biosynthesis lauroyl acyltransferase, partial [Microvirga sp.]
MQQPHRSRNLVSRFIGSVVVGIVRGVFAFSRALGPERSGAVGAALTRTFGPLLRAHRTALA